jgi:hypothetical protein
MTQRRIGCLTSFIIVIGVVWLIYQFAAPKFSSPPISKPQKLSSKIVKKIRCGIQNKDWKKLADNIIKDYQGKIISIEKLNSTTCWAVLSPNLSNIQAVEIAENIGYYVRNSPGITHGITPSIRVFLRGKHVALARPSRKYVGEIDLQDWNPTAFNGKYRP